jgi:mannitol-1-phosphate 5-dehydrogenase
MSKAVHLGAGNIGRGFLGQLYCQSGWETVFVDVEPAVLKAIEERREYEIHIVGPGAHTVQVTNIRAVNGMDVPRVAEEIESADLVSTAVGANVLRRIAGPLARGIERRAARHPAPPINVLLCENLLHAGRIMRDHLQAEIRPEAAQYLATHVGLVETVISRMVPIVPPEKKAADPLYIAVEEYARLPVDAQAFVGPIPEIRGLDPTPRLIAYEERKLFTHNCGHTLCALWGYEKGYEYLWQAAEDPDIRQRALEALWESGEALVRKHLFRREEHQAHIDDLLRRFCNRDLGDTVYRVARDPVRKLGPNERLVGAATLAIEFGIEPRRLVQGIASALRYDNPQDDGAVDLQRRLKEQGLAAVLSSVSGLNENSPLFHSIAREMAPFIR